MKFVIGRSGTGKTTYCLNEIKENLNNNFDKPLILIVPEQFTFETEKKLISNLNKKGIINVEVLSFKRLAYKIFNLDNIKVNLLSDTGKMMLIYFIMQKLDKSLTILKSSEKNIGLVNTVIKEISEFKRYSITPDMLKGIDLKNDLSNSKIDDLYLIYSEYENYIKEKYIDSNDELSLLASSIKDNKYLEGAKIWIDEFDGFIPQELEIIKELSKKCDITISITDGSEEFFESNKTNINKLQKIFKNNAEVINLKDNVRFNNSELKHIEKNIFKFPYLKYEEEVNNITISSYNNYYDEIESVAQKIKLEIYNNKELRYENIAILTRNIEDYKDIFKMIFDLYNIPYFFDDKKALSLEPLMNLILSFIDIVTSNYKYEDMFSYLKTNLIKIDNLEDIDLLENYILKWGIKGKAWESDFTFEDPKIDLINQTRKNIITPILNFKNKFSGKKSVNEIIKGLFEFLNEIEVYDIIKEKIDILNESKDNINITIALEYTKVWNHLMNIFDDMNLTIGEEQISFDKFKSIFKMGISAEEIALIPTTLDKVIIGDVERTRTSSIKSLYIIGVNDGNYPKTYNDEGFINDLERQTLLDNGIEIAKDTKKLLIQEYFNIYKALTIASDNLNISYPISNLEGFALRPAFLISQIKNMFPKIIEKSYLDKKEIIYYSKNGTFPIFLNKLRKDIDSNIASNDVKLLYSWYLENDNRLNSILDGIDFKNTIENISKENTKMLYGTSIDSSVSKLEKYKLCPFSYYLKYGINLKEREVFKLDVPDIGSLMHEVIEVFSKEVLEKDINLRNINKEDVYNMVSNILDEVIVNFRNSLFNSTAKLRNLSLRLKAQIQKMIWIIVLQIQMGEFNIAGSEVEFGRAKNDYPPITINLSTGENIVLNGKVDRIDIANTEEGDFIRIVDYKSSAKEIKLSDVYYGIQLQLITYMDAMAQDKFIPGGVLYLNLGDKIIDSKKRLEKEEIEDLIIKNLRMNGLIISDARLINAMDNQFNEESKVINIKEKNGKYTGMPVVSKEEFEKLREHIKTTIKEIGEEIIFGKIENSPLYKKDKQRQVCDYCEYAEICRFEKSLGNKYRYNKKLSNDEVIRKLMNGV